ncbi:MAG: flagellar biosynthetic protein FliO [Polyangiaceae bacterium]
MTPLRQRTLTLVLGACFVLCVASVHAAQAPDASLKSPSWLAPHSGPKLAKPVAGGPRVGLGRSLGVLLLTAVLGGTALYLRSKKNRLPKQKLAQLRVVGSTKLGGRAQLVLAEVDGRRILLGVTDSSVRKLGWLEEVQSAEAEDFALAPRPRLVAAGVDLAARPARAAAEYEPEPAAAPKRSFRDLLASAVGNIGHRPEDDSVALTLAAETKDTFTRSTPRSAPLAAERRPDARKTGNPQMIDLEGQAKGLLARLGEPRA